MLFGYISSRSAGIIERFNIDTNPLTGPFGSPKKSITKGEKPVPVPPVKLLTVKSVFEGFNFCNNGSAVFSLSSTKCFFAAILPKKGIPPIPACFTRCTMSSGISSFSSSFFFPKMNFTISSSLAELRIKILSKLNPIFSVSSSLIDGSVSNTKQLIG